MQELKGRYNYEVEEIDALDIDKSAISSSRIRRSLEQGHINMANNFLGHNYFLYARVIHGKKLGRTIGYPTANLQIDSQDKLIPKKGVYFVSVVVKGNAYYGMMNIGINPTTDTSLDLKIEVNIFDFEEDIYKQTIRINFLSYIREEKKFASIDELKTAIDNDKRKCMSLIEEINNTLCAVIKK